MFNYSVEVLIHYFCQECENWFSISQQDNSTVPPIVDGLTCPHCGKHSVNFIEFEG